MRVVAIATGLLVIASGAYASQEQADRADAVDLDGSWYVLVHYRDRGGDGPDEVQWLDAVWRFASEGVGGDHAIAPRLRWTIFEGVRLRDARGRFEVTRDGRRARTLGAWQPDEAQLAEIRAGLAVDDHAARAKTLRRDAAGGWRSTGAAQARSASSIAYHEAWRIDAPTTAPVFTRVDAMGGGRTDRLSGTTRFLTREVLAGGDELLGDFYRDDGVLEGSFRMWRMRDRAAADSRAPHDD